MAQTKGITQQAGEGPTPAPMKSGKGAIAPLTPENTARTPSSKGSKISGKKGKVTKQKAKRIAGTKVTYQEALESYLDMAIHVKLKKKGSLGHHVRNLGKAIIANSTWHVSGVLQGIEPSIMLSRSNPFDFSEPAGRATNQLMEQIYKDIHEESFDSTLRSTESIDLNTLMDEIENIKPPLAASAYYTSRLRSDLASLETLLVIENARRCSRTPAFRKDNGLLQQLTTEDYATMDSLRNGPDVIYRLRSSASTKARQIVRYGKFAADQGWMMLSILAHSFTFRGSSHCLNDESWSALVQCIVQNNRSIEMFAKVRGLPWERILDSNLLRGPALTMTEIRSSFDLLPDHPHHYTLVDERFPVRIRHNNEDMRNVDDHVYDRKAFGPRSRKPPGWPKPWGKVGKPLDRKDDGEVCTGCGSSNCACGPNDFTHPLVEIKSYPKKGNGVRALQYISKGDILGEYLGEVQAYKDRRDQIYAFFVTRPLPTSGNIVVAKISAAESGNWTRFLNHSCEASTAFTPPEMYGDRYRVLIKATRDINIFEEVTVDYVLRKM
ncbi:MAG: hypothetical protein M1827_001044 [Pycnora praestabilis]|nr:MAG: hypothetical protein M1827_001044 [Pycnora praestabilis]